MKELRFKLQLDYEETSKMATSIYIEARNKRESVLSLTGFIFNEGLWVRSR